VPCVEEFHVGFEYEHQMKKYGGLTGERHSKLRGVISREWVNQDLDWEYTLEYMKTLIDSGTIRVKHLDREDIESLGFEIPQGGLDYIYKKVVGDIYYILITNPEYPTKIEIRCSHPSWAYGSFLGTIKNKSELKRVLTQIGII